mgnify:CR=1 FL=1
MGGEKHGSDSWSGVCQGSPPRGRGKGGLLVCGQGRHGITPAWAGKRVCSGLCYVLGWDHPRVGGEKGRAVLGPVLGTGSPPRGRGKDLAKSARWKGAGITPAWAGKRPRWPCGWRPGRDHPRVGGEKWHLRQCSKELLGSPPRGRGKVDAGIPMLAPVRITPAWAGKSIVHYRIFGRCQDHPRVGGEKPQSLWVFCFHLGSPPRGRGKEVKDLREAIQMRITPAWAGKSHGLSSASPMNRDHPRVGGEKTKKIP